MIQTTRCIARAVIVAVISLPQLAHADFSDNLREVLGRRNQTAHPSVVQVLAPEPGALSRGSGTLIHVDGEYGYVITNWHVVRDAPGDVIIVFPDGHQSLARVLKTDKDWDLALLLIWRGNAPPMPLASVAPQPGEPLTIAGYGGEGKFRAAKGVFTTYAAPEPDMPFEMFEVSVAARQGDSGGPIVNGRGELAGVLFGAGDGRTTGTQVHRVRDFVNDVLQGLRDQAMQEQATAIAAAPMRPRIANEIAEARRDSSAAGRSRQDWSGPQLPQEYIPPVAAPNQLAHQSPPQERPDSQLPDRQWSAEESGQLVDGAAQGFPVHRDRGLSAVPDVPIVEDRALMDESFASRGERPQVDFSLERQPPPLASIRSSQPVADGFSRSAIPNPRNPSSRIPSGGITWDQLRSFFAAVGVFAMLNTMTKTLFGRRE